MDVKHSCVFRCNKWIYIPININWPTNQAVSSMILYKNVYDKNEMELVQLLFLQRPMRMKGTILVQTWVLWQSVLFHERIKTVVLWQSPGSQGRQFDTYCENSAFLTEDRDKRQKGLAGGKEKGNIPPDWSWIRGQGKEHQPWGKDFWCHAQVVLDFTLFVWRFFFWNPLYHPQLLTHLLILSVFSFSFTFSYIKLSLSQFKCHISMGSENAQLVQWLMQYSITHFKIKFTNFWHNKPPPVQTVFSRILAICALLRGSIELHCTIWLEKYGESTMMISQGQGSV